VKPRNQVPLDTSARLHPLIMKRFIHFIAAVASICAVNAKGPISFIDCGDNAPVAGATVIDKSGMILGMTDENGKIAIANDDAFPISVSCIGYEPLSVAEYKESVVLAPFSYQLNEIVVTPAEKPVIRVVCFAREYSSGITGADTLQLYCEYMTEAFLVNGKVKGYKKTASKPKAKSVKRYAKITKDGMDSIFSPKRNDDITKISWLNFMTFLPEGEHLLIPEAIKNGADSDTIMGKHGPKFTYQMRNGIFTKTADMLSDHKDRKWSPWFLKIIGMTMDIDAGTWSLSFSNKKADEKFSIYDFRCGTYNIHIIGKGKWIKKAFNTTQPIEMHSYLEMYPIEITQSTVEEYKAMVNDDSGIPFKYPLDIQPLSPVIQQFVEEIDNKSAK